MKRTLACLMALALCLTLPLTAWAREPWDCPECGRTGNTGNFCGKCAHPAPEPSPEPSPEPAVEVTPSPVPVWRPAAGSYVTFGRYEQDGSTADGQEPVEWVVLDVQGDRALLLARYGLDAQPYNANLMETTWEKCDLRQWLNNVFFNAAFTAGERAAVCLTDVDNGGAQGYDGYNTYGGGSTQDRVFLLSHGEAFETYLRSDSARQTRPTAYASSRGAWGTDGDWGWWLRSPGYFQYYAELVGRDGTRGSNYVDSRSGVVRPAVWVDLTANPFGR